MSLHRLEIAPRDVSAAALGLLIDAPAPPALAELTVSDTPGVTGCTLILGVLGASHVVTARLGEHEITEEVSCDAVAAGGVRLPQRTSDGGYELVTTTIEVSAAELSDTAGRLTALAETDDRCLCGAFPGAPSALTAMTARGLRGGGWAWQTWHLYPNEESSVIVRTQSRWRP